jgi:putative salt-induced outer membrane protein YdiY
MNNNLKDKSLIELKAIAYDLISMQQSILNDLNIVNQELSIKSKEETVLNQDIKLEIDGQ